MFGHPGHGKYPCSLHQSGIAEVVDEPGIFFVEEREGGLFIGVWQKRRIFETRKWQRRVIEEMASLVAASVIGAISLIKGMMSALVLEEIDHEFGAGRLCFPGASHGLPSVDVEEVARDSLEEFNPLFHDVSRKRFASRMK